VIIEGIEVENKESVFQATCFDPKTKDFYHTENKGYKFVYCGATWFLHKGINGGWGITESSTGTYAAGGESRASALKALISNISQRGLNAKKLAKAIRRTRQVNEELYANKTVSR